MKKELIGLEAEEVSLPVGFDGEWRVVSSQRWLHIRNGRLSVEGPDCRCRIGGGGLALIPIGVRHRLRVIGSNPVVMELIRIRNRCFAQSNTVDREAAQLLLVLAEHAKQNHYRLKLPPQPSRHLREGISELVTIAKTAQGGQHDDPRPMALALKGALLAVFSRLSTVPAFQHAVLPQGQVDPSWHIRHVLAYIDEHVEENLTINQAAAIAGFGRTRFIAIFKAVTGMTFAAYVTKIRLGRAAQLLKYSRRSVLDIIFECGFGSVSRFYEAFNQEFGESPAKYRKK